MQLEKKTMVEQAEWSSLPEDIIFNILSRLKINPCSDSVVTISDTNFDIEYSQTCCNLSALLTFAKRTPFVNTFHIRLRAIGFQLEPIIDTWARQLLAFNIQHFSIASDRDHWPRKMDAQNVFQLHSLVSLELDTSTRGDPWVIPDSINLPNLKKLSLILVNLEALEIIIRSCPLLEDFTFRVSKPTEGRRVLISSTNLKRLCILQGWPFNFSVIIEASELEHVTFAARGYMSEQMLNSISHVKSFVLCEYYTSIGVYGYKGPITSITFANLTNLTVILLSLERFQYLSSMLHCPNLEVLVINVDTTRDRNDISKMGLVSEDTLVLFKHVKRLELDTNKVRYDEKLLSLATYFLRIGRVLEKLIIRASCSPGVDDEVDNLAKVHFCQSLIESQKGSNMCEIELVGGYESLLS